MILKTLELRGFVLSNEQRLDRSPANTLEEVFAD